MSFYPVNLVMVIATFSIFDPDPLIDLFFSLPSIEPRLGAITYSLL